jgi:hypothetical protein
MANIKKPQKDKQRSTKHTYKTKDRVTRTPLKTGGGPITCTVICIVYNIYILGTCHYLSPGGGGGKLF